MRDQERACFNATQSVPITRELPTNTLQRSQTYAQLSGHLLDPCTGNYDGSAMPPPPPRSCPWVKLLLQPFHLSLILLVSALEAFLVDQGQQCLGMGIVGGIPAALHLLMEHTPSRQ